MSEQIKPSVTNPTIADVYEQISENRLELSPDFQRKFVWTHEHQEAFLDTILKGFPFPEVYVCKGKTNIDTLKTSQKVIDGQQRLTTIKNYIEGNFKFPLKTIPYFKDLEEVPKTKFLEYQLVKRDLGDISEELVREIFRRINLTKFKLEDIEIHNAIYDGQFIQLAKELANNIDLSKYGVFYDSEFTRMVDVHFFLQIMSTLERGGYYNRDTELEKCVAEFNEEYPNWEQTKKQIHDTFEIITGLDLEPDSIWFRKSNFFTLVAELCFASNVPEDLLVRLQKFENQILEYRYDKESDCGIYYGYMYAGTNHRKARVTRSEIFRKYVLKDA